MSYPGVSVLMHDSKRPLHVFMSLDSIIKQTRSIELVIFWFLVEVSKLLPHPLSSPQLHYPIAPRTEKMNGEYNISRPSGCSHPLKTAIGNMHARPRWSKVASSFDEEFRADLR
jgi:hypothetical protein